MNTLQLTDQTGDGTPSSRGELRREGAPAPLINGLQVHDLTVTREAGGRSCVLSGKKDGREIERVTTMDPQMMVDYLDLVYPGEIVRWRLLPCKRDDVR